MRQEHICFIKTKINILGNCFVSLNCEFEIGLFFSICEHCEPCTHILNHRNTLHREEKPKIIQVQKIFDLIDLIKDFVSRSKIRFFWFIFSRQVFLEKEKCWILSKKYILKRKIFVIFTISKQSLISLRPIKRVAGKPQYKNLRVCRALTDDPQDKNKILLGSWLGSYNYLIKWRPRFNACCNNNCGGFVLMWPKASRQGGWMVGLLWLKISFEKLW